MNRGELGDGGLDCGACAVPCRVLGTGGGAVQLGADDAGIWYATVPCTRTAQGTVCASTVFVNIDPDGSARRIGRFPEDGGSGVPVTVVADEEALYFHSHSWQATRSVYRLARDGGSPTEAFTTRGRVTAAGLDGTNVYALDYEPEDGGTPASLQLLAHERQTGVTTPLTSLPAGTGAPEEASLQAGELLVWRRSSAADVLERYLVSGSQPVSSHVFAGGVRDIALAWPDPIVFAMTGQRGVADLVRAQRDGGTEVLLRAAPVSALDTDQATQLAVGGESVVVAHQFCGGIGEIMCPPTTGEVYRLSLTGGQQEDLCRGHLAPVQVLTDGNVVYVQTRTGLLELRPASR